MCVICLVQLPADTNVISHLRPDIIHKLNGPQDRAFQYTIYTITILHWSITNIPTTTALLICISSLFTHLLRIVIVVCSFATVTWICAKNFDRGNGVVLHAVWLIPFIIVLTSREGNEEKICEE